MQWLYCVFFVAKEDKCWQKIVDDVFISLFLYLVSSINYFHSWKFFLFPCFLLRVHFLLLSPFVHPTRTWRWNITFSSFPIMITKAKPNMYEAAELACLSKTLTLEMFFYTVVIIIEILPALKCFIVKFINNSSVINQNYLKQQNIDNYYYFKNRY